MTKVIYGTSIHVYNRLRLNKRKGGSSNEERRDFRGMTVYDDHSIGSIQIETILLFNIEQIITKYEQKVYHCLTTKEYEKSEKTLTDFCLELLELTDEEQVFIARTFFISLITDTIKIHTKKNQLHPKILSFSYETISIIEQYENLSEFILFIPTFVKRIANQIIGDQAIAIGNVHVEKALQLINFYLTNNCLTVQWVAKQLDISTTHLSNVFKLQMGETINQYITKRKMNEIAFEIQHSNVSMTKIQTKYGFVNQSHFIQQFKKVKGMTPLQYKQQAYQKLENIT